MTKIVAGSSIIVGEIKNYEFTEDQASFKLFINPRDPVNAIEISLPRPNAALISAIEKAGVMGLRDSEINFNKNTLKLNLGNRSLAGMNRTDQKAIGGVFFG